jgi:Fe-S-cluster containining protein
VKNFPETDEYAESIDPSVQCTACDAVCCRLTVVLMPEDHVPRHLVVRNEQGVEVMARNEEGWCAAIDPLRMRCSIYADRPAICRSFTMGAAYCLDIRDTYRDQQRRGIPLTLY